MGPLGQSWYFKLKQNNEHLVVNDRVLFNAEEHSLMANHVRRDNRKLATLYVVNFTDKTYTKLMEKPNEKASNDNLSNSGTNVPSNNGGY